MAPGRSFALTGRRCKNLGRAASSVV